MGRESILSPCLAGAPRISMIQPAKPIHQHKQWLFFAASCSFWDTLLSQPSAPRSAETSPCNEVLKAFTPLVNDAFVMEV